jgi:hypothetical protein
LGKVNPVIMHRQISDRFSTLFNLSFTKHKSYLYECDYECDYEYDIF